MGEIHLALKRPDYKQLRCVDSHTAVFTSDEKGGIKILQKNHCLGCKIGSVGQSTESGGQLVQYQKYVQIKHNLRDTKQPQRGHKMTTRKQNNYKEIQKDTKLQND